MTQHTGLEFQGVQTWLSTSRCESLSFSPPLYVRACQVTSIMSDFLRPYGLYVAFQAPLSMGFPRQEDWHWLPFPSPGDLPDPEIKPRSPVVPMLQVDSLPLSHWRSPILCKLGPNSSHLRGRHQRRQWQPHSSTLAWKTPWMEKSGGPQSMGSRTVGHD